MSNEESFLTARITTRESSTLTFAALAASSSLVVLALIVERDLGLIYPLLKGIGVLFALLGVVYREVTFWSVDKTEFRILTKRLDKDFIKELRLARSPLSSQIATFIRRFAIRFFLNLPVVAWFAFISPLVASRFSLWLVLGALLATFLSIFDLVPPADPD